MRPLVNTTHYHAILLRKRWREIPASSRDAFDLTEELERIDDAPPLTSAEVSALERWASTTAPADPSLLPQ
jgi:hypothetical protein